MRIGVYFDLRDPDGPVKGWSRTYSFTLELCAEAERLGLDSVWFSEHHEFDDGYLTQPLTFAAAAAARTSRVRLGTAVLLAPLRHPVHIAEEATLVDLISDGRLDLGLGAGYRASEFELFGADIGARYRTTDRTVRELREIWARDGSTPVPVQDPVPIWLGYQGPRGAHRAGRLGEGLLSVDPRLVEPYRQGLLEGGHPVESARMSGVLNVFVTDDPERDWPAVGKQHAYQWDSYRRHGVAGTDLPVPPPLDPDRLRTKGLGHAFGSLLYGTPLDVAPRIREYLAGVPVDTVFFWVRPGGLPEEATVRHLETIATGLLPLL